MTENPANVLRAVVTARVLFADSVIVRYGLWGTAFDSLTPAAARAGDEAPNPYEHYQPAWSPGGDRIAFVTCSWAFYFCSSSAVSVMSAVGSGIVRLVTASGFASPT